MRPRTRTRFRASSFHPPLNTGIACNAGVISFIFFVFAIVGSCPIGLLLRSIVAPSALPSSIASFCVYFVALAGAFLITTVHALSPSTLQLGRLGFSHRRYYHRSHISRLGPLKMKKVILRYNIRSRAPLEFRNSTSAVITVFARGVKERCLPIQICLSSSILDYCNAVSIASSIPSVGSSFSVYYFNYSSGPLHHNMLLSSLGVSDGSTLEFRRRVRGGAGQDPSAPIEIDSETESTRSQHPAEQGESSRSSGRKRVPTKRKREADANEREERATKKAKGSQKGKRVSKGPAATTSPSKPRTQTTIVEPELPPTPSTTDAGWESETSSVDDEISTQSQQRRKTSAIHFFFTEASSATDKRYCRVCEKIVEKDTSFASPAYGASTGNSTLRNHLKRQHPKKYEKLLQIESADDPKSSLNQLFQTTIDNHLQPNIDQPRYTAAGLALACLKLISACDLPISTVELPEFRDLILLLKPEINSNDIPGRTKMSELALSEFEKEKKDLRARLHACPGRISLTCDTWTSDTMNAYLAVTAHYMSTSGSDWCLENELVGFKLLHGSHSGLNLARVVFDVCNDMGIVKKIGWMTTDNASNNDTMMTELAYLVQVAGLSEDQFSDNGNHIRCMPHIYNLAVNDVLSALSQHQAFTDEAIASSAEFSEQDVRKDPVLAIRGFVVAVRSSPQRKEAFRELQQTINATNKATTAGGSTKQSVTKTYELKLDVRTRWSSTFFMLERAWKLRPAIDMMVNLPQHAPLRKFALTEEQWSMVELAMKILRAAHQGQQLLSGDQHPTLHLAIPAIEYLLGEWESRQKKIERKARHLPVEEKEKYFRYVGILEAGIEKLGAYYLKMESSDAYANAMILTPYIKMRYLRKWWDQRSLTSGKLLADEAQETFSRTFTTNYAEKTDSPPQMKVHRVWGHMFVESKDDGELVRYLNTPPSVHPSNGGPTALEFWKMHSSEYPQLSKMAIDYLAIQGSATPVERVWSSAGETDTKRRNRLSPTRLEALQFLKAGYRRRREKRMTIHERAAIQRLLLVRIDNGIAEDDVLKDADLYFPEDELTELED